MHDQWNKVSRGFMLVYIGMVLMVLAGTAGFVGSLLLTGVGAAGGGGAAAGRGLAAVFGVLMIGVVLAALAGGVLAVVGELFCLAVPGRAGSARTLIVTSVGMKVVALALCVGSAAGLAAGLRISFLVVIGLQMGGMLLIWISGVIFIFFTKSVAEYVKEYDLAEMAASILRLWLMTLGCYVFNMVLTIAMMGIGGGGGGAAGGVGCITAIVGLAAFVMSVIALIKYIALMRGMSGATGEFARGVRYKERERQKRKKRAQQDDDDDDEDDRPRSRRSSRYDDDEDDEDDRPRARGRRASRYDDEDDEDDRPRKRDRRDR